MARLLFAAHDPSGANLLLALAPAARVRSHDLTFLAAGPAAKAFAAAGEKFLSDAAFDGAGRPDALVTGSAMGDFDRDLWRRAKAAGVPSLGVVDAWTNVRRRFRHSDGTDALPDAVGAVDEPMRDAILGWYDVPVHVVGQPHLQALERRLRGRRAGHKARRPPRIVFFSECLREDGLKDRIGFDQFDAADLLFPSLAAAGPVEFAIKPHPREAPGAWRDYLAAKPSALAPRILDTPSEAAMMAADGVLGMSTMVLIEAALAAIPILAVQPRRKEVVNTMLERLPAPPVVDPADVPAALAAFLAAARTGRAPAADRLAPILADADKRLLDAVDALLTGR